MGRLFNRRNKSNIEDKKIQEIIELVQDKLGVNVTAIQVDKNGKPIKEVTVPNKKKKNDTHADNVVNTIKEELKKEDCNPDKISKLLNSLEPDEISRTITNQKLSIRNHTKNLSDDEIFTEIVRSTSDLLSSIGRNPSLGVIFLCDKEGNVSISTIGINKKNVAEFLKIFGDTIKHHIDE